MAKRRKSKLEKASWFAAILSVIAAIGTWLFPHPLLLTELSQTKHVVYDDMGRTLRVVAIFCCISLFITAFTFAKISNKELIVFHFKIWGDWTGRAIIVAGLVHFFFIMAVIMRTDIFQFGANTILLILLLFLLPIYSLALIFVPLLKRMGIIQV